MKFKELYPDNICFIDKQNEGVSTARNVGLRHASGKYVNFLDSDDKWSENAFELAMDFFSCNPSIKVVTTRKRFFGRREGEHVLSYMYLTDCVVDIRKAPDYVQNSLCSAFVARDCFSVDPFDPTLKNLEDSIVMTKILLGCMHYGLLSVPCYWYRKRESVSSAVDLASKSLEWYLEVPQKSHKYLLSSSKASCGKVLPYVQYLVMYDLQWRISSETTSVLDEHQKFLYREAIVDILRDIDDEIILAQRNLSRELKLYTLALKYSLTFNDSRKRLIIVGNQVFWVPPGTTSPVFFYSQSLDAKLWFDFIDKNEKEVVYEGRIPTLFPLEDVNLSASVGDRRYEAELFEREDLSVDAFFDEGFYKVIGFKISLPVDSVDFFLAICSHVVRPALAGGRYARLLFGETRSYAPFSEKVMTSTKRGKLALESRGIGWKIKREILYQAHILIKEKSARDVLKYRKYALWPASSRKTVWLIADRVNKAGDNGEALFQYLTENPIKGVKPYFVLHKDSPDYQRMRKNKGRSVVAFGSSRHKKLLMRAKFVITSGGDDWPFLLFESQHRYLRGLLNHKYVFLQHGITQHDLSSWLKRTQKNLAMITVASPKEAASIIGNRKYGYDDSVVKCTGFARHDKLLAGNNATARKLLIMPTWRKNLTCSTDFETGLRPPMTGFRQSEYFVMYNHLINDVKIISAAKENGYTIDFVLHPSLSQEFDQFDGNSVCSIIRDGDYCSEFQTASILVTDYSSVAFDFALLKKPLAYFQFDVDDFYANHTLKKGYFNYDKDGFGPVIESYDKLIEWIIDSMKNPVMNELYQERVDKFFFEPEGSRCEQIVNSLLKI